MDAFATESTEVVSACTVPPIALKNKFSCGYCLISIVNNIVIRQSGVFGYHFYSTKRHQLKESGTELDFTGSRKIVLNEKNKHLFIRPKTENSFSTYIVRQS